MTLEDLAKSILPAYLHEKVLKMDRNQFERVFTKNVRQTLRNSADINKDNIIEKAEFIYILTLLSIPQKDFQIFFKMFDVDGVTKNYFFFLQIFFYTFFL